MPANPAPSNPKWPQTATTWRRFSRILTGSARPSPLIRRVIVIAEKSLGAEHPNVGLFEHRKKGGSRNRRMASDDLLDCILGETDLAGDKSIGEPFLVEREHPLSLPVAGPLTLFAAKDNTARLSRLEAGFHPLADEGPARTRRDRP
jgi:hypothetical protein